MEKAQYNKLAVIPSGTGKLSVQQPELPRSYFPGNYYLFNLSHGRKKIKVLLSDILLVRAIKNSHQDKILYLKGNVSHEVRGYRFDHLMDITGFLIQVNKSHLVSPESINAVDEDNIILNGMVENEMPLYISLSRRYRKPFFDFFNYSRLSNKTLVG